MRFGNSILKARFGALAALSVLSACAAMPSAPPPAPVPEARRQTVDEPAHGKALAMRAEAITATGYAVIGVQGHKSAPQQRVMAIRAARIDAYRGLAEQIYGIQLDTNTTVSDLTVVSDTFRSRVEGVIHGARLISITPVNHDTYEVTLGLDGSVVSDLRTLYLAQFAARRR